MASSLFQAVTQTRDDPLPDLITGVENVSAISTGGIATGTQNVFIINKTNTTLKFPEIVSSDAALVHDGVFPRTLDSGESYRFVATATGPNHTLSFAASTITSPHTFNAVDPANAHGDNNQRVYLDQID